MNYNIDSINYGTCTNGIHLPALEYISGKRKWYAISLNYTTLGNFVNTSGIKKKNVEIIGPKVRNRFLDVNHKNEIKEYLKIEPRFTIPPITLVSPNSLFFKPYTFNGEAPSIEAVGSRAGIVLLPINYKFECLDGNHRCVAIKEIVEENIDIVDKSNILLNIVIEDDVRKIRQDFVDVNKNAKPTTASINTLFDTRDKISELVVNTVESITFLSQCTELLTTTISKNSRNLYTINNIKNSIVELSGIDSQSSAKSASKKISEKLNEKEFNNQLNHKIQLFFKYLEQNKEIVEYKECIDELSKSQQVRSKSLLTSGSGIVIAARVANYIFNNINPVLIEKKLQQLFEIDWKRTNELFEGIIILDGSKILKSRHSIKETSELLIQYIKELN